MVRGGGLSLSIVGVLDCGSVTGFTDGILLGLLVASLEGEAIRGWSLFLPATLGLVLVLFTAPSHLLLD